MGLLYPDEVMAHPWRRAINGADLIDRLAADLWFAQNPDAYDRLCGAGDRRGAGWGDVQQAVYPGG